MSTAPHDSPIATLPLRVGGRTFTVMPRCSARFIAQALSPPLGETNIEAVERVIRTIASLITDERQADEFSAMWGDPNDPRAGGHDQGELLAVWEEMAVHYTARPTDGPSPFSSGFGTLSDGSTSTPASPSLAVADSAPSQATSVG